MKLTLCIVFGAFLSLLFVAYAIKTRDWRAPVALGLVVAALIYVGFAVVGKASAFWILLELGGVFFYSGLAWLGYKKSSWWLAIGWTFHVLWDVALHQFASGSGFTPAWYPPVCIGFDLVVAFAVLVITVRRRERRAQPSS
jgi:hypothetical protein